MRQIFVFVLKLLNGRITKAEAPDSLKHERIESGWS